MTDFFLDMGIIVAYASDISIPDKIKFEDIDFFIEDTKKFVIKYKKNRFCTCYYITENDLPKFKRRRKIMREEIRSKLNDFKYKIGSSKKAKENLYDFDVKWCERIYNLKNKIGEKELFQLVLNIDATFDVRVDFFMANEIEEVVIPIDEIDKELRSHYHTFIRNYSDSNVVASAIQYNTKHKAITVATTDIKDMGWKIKEWLEMDMKLNDMYKVPDIKYIKALV